MLIFKRIIHNLSTLYKGNDMLKFRKLFAAALALCLFFIPSAVAISAISVEKNSEDSRLLSVLSERVTLMSNNSEELSISQIKDVHDFSGELYQVVECSPRGYMIYHPASAVVVESSPTSFSPYKDYSGENLYYGGPTEYYVRNEKTFNHTITNESINLAVDIERMKLTSEKYSTALNQIKDVALLDYLSTGNQIARTTSIQAYTSDLGGGVTFEEVQWFQGLTPCGYFEGKRGNESYGCCGFVGLNIIYAFFDKFVDTKYMPDSYWTSSSKAQLKNWDNSFTKVLYDLGPKDGTTSMHIHNISKKYNT